MEFGKKRSVRAALAFALFCALTPISAQGAEVNTPVPAPTNESSLAVVTPNEPAPAQPIKEARLVVATEVLTDRKSVV